MKEKGRFAVRSRTEIDFRRVYIRKKMHLKGHKAAIYTLEQGDAPNTIFSGGGDGLVVKWDMDNPELGQVVAQVKANIFSMKYIPSLNWMVIGNMHGGVHWVNLNTNENIKNIAHHQKGVFDIQLIKGHILTAGGDGKLTKWSNEDCRPLETFHLSNSSLRTIDYLEKRNELAIGSSDYSIYILDADDFSIKKHIKDAHTNSVFTVKYSPNGAYLMSGGRDAYLRAWDVENDYEQVSAQPAHWFTINKIAFSPDGKVFATASRDKSIKIWEANTFAIVKVIEKVRLTGHTNSINSLFWSDYNDWLVSCGDDRTVMGWRVIIHSERGEEKEVKEIKQNIQDELNE